jgi:hypothetical protein
MDKMFDGKIKLNAEPQIDAKAQRFRSKLIKFFKKKLKTLSIFLYIFVSLCFSRLINPKSWL